MNEFAINWIKGADYAEITVPSGTALKSKLLKLAEENRMKRMPGRASILHRGLFLLFGGSGRENCERGKNIGTWSKRTESDQICC